MVSNEVGFLVHEKPVCRTVIDDEIGDDSNEHKDDLGEGHKHADNTQDNCVCCGDVYYHEASELGVRDYFSLVVLHCIGDPW